MALSGCFAHTAAPILGPGLRSDAPGLEGAYAPDAGAPQAGRFEIQRAGRGVYWMRGAGAALDPEPDPEAVRTARALAGDCAVLETPEDIAECARPDAGFCAEAAFVGADTAEACTDMIAALRGAPNARPLPDRMRAYTEAIRWVAEALPYRDEVLFTTRALRTGAGGEVWALAQARHVGSVGPWTDLGVLSPQILPLDLALLRIDGAGLKVYATAPCLPPGAEPTAPLGPEAALRLASACIPSRAAIGTDSGGEETMRAFARVE